MPDASGDQTRLGPARAEDRGDRGVPDSGRRAQADPSRLDRRSRQARLRASLADAGHDMTAARVPLFCDTALARRIECAEATLIAASSDAAGRRGAAPPGFVMPLAGGVASFADAGSPFNKVAGLG